MSLPLSPPDCIRWFVNQQTLHWRRQPGGDPV